MKSAFLYWFCWGCENWNQGLERLDLTLNLHPATKKGLWWPLSFRSVANGFTCGLHIEVFPISLMGMHSLHISVHFEKGNLNFFRKNHPRHLLFSICRDKICIRTGTVIKLKVALPKLVLILNTALRPVFQHGVCHILHVLQPAAHESLTPEGAAWQQGCLKNYLHGEDLS